MSEHELFPCRSGGPQDVQNLHEAVQDAVNKDVSVVVAAGNVVIYREETFEYSYPGSYNEVVQVGAVGSSFNSLPLLLMQMKK